MKPEMKIDTYGEKRWFLNGKLHREDGPAVEYPNGTKHWFLNGEWHRKDGPAYEGSDGTKQWFLNDKLHREDGPAVEEACGTKFWFLNDNEVSWQEVFKQAKTQEQQVRILISALTTP
jgi:hypothetical protein